MKPQIRSRFSFIVSLLFVLSTPVYFFSQDFRPIRNGVEYAEVTREISGLKVNMNLLRLDLAKVRLDVVHAADAAIGTEATSSIAKRRGALAAVNAGFFRLDNSTFAGDAAGVFQVDGKLLSEANNARVALLINNSFNDCAKCRIPKIRTDVSIGHIKTYAEFWSAGQKSNISGINRQRKENDAVLYTPEFGASTPQTEIKGLEIVIQNKKIKEILETNGGTIIPKGGFVLSASGAKRNELASMTVIGKEALVILGSYVEKDPASDSKAAMAFIDTEDIVGGVPQLIKNGKIDITWEQEKTTKAFVDTRHPRTAVAKLKDGRFLMITVDGRSESSGGISLYDLAAYLLSLGATDAMNLDGGGSTTMFLDDKVVNHPSDKEGERKVSDAILVFPRTNRVEKNR